MSRKPDIEKSCNLPDRRINGERRINSDRRSASERRHDFRDGSEGKRKTIRVWLRSVTKARLGVDRRKEERRGTYDRRQQNMHSVLTKDELRDLLSL